MIDVKALTESIFRQIHAYVSPALQAIQRQVVELEAKLAKIPAGDRGSDGEKGEAGDRGEKGDPGERGQDGADGKDGAQGEAGAAGKDGAPGKDVDPETLARAVADGVEKALPGAVQKALDALMPELVAKAAALVPVPRDGVDGKTPDEAAILSSLTEKMLRAVDALPKPTDGKDGRDAPEVDLDALVVKVLPLIPKPRDGVDGLNGRDAPDVESIAAAVMDSLPQVHDGADGRNGIDGKSVTMEDVRPVLDAELARYQLELERRAADTLHAAIDKMPAPANGQDGKDGLSPDDFEVTLDGRILTLSLRCGERVVTRELKVPFPIDRGVYRSGTAYEKGDVVTYGGSQWIVLNDTRDKPPSDNWRCQVRRGQDGKA